MKNWLLLFIIFVLISIGCLYFIIPNRIPIHESLKLAVNAKGFTRNILDEKKWNQWWPGNDSAFVSNERALSFRYNGNTYNILEKRMSSIVLSVQDNTDSIQTEVFFIPIKEDSVKMSWVAQKLSSANPAKRLQIFFKTKNIIKDLKTILQSIKKFHENQDNLYGIKIKKEHVVDSNLISTSIETKGFPNTENIYSLIDKLQAFAVKNGAKQTGHPMLHINTTDSLMFLTRIALPVNKKLSDEGDVVYRWMLGGGNIIVTEVNGGSYTIQKAFTEMENYVQDFNRTAPAIPFQSLITDRRKEPDTAKWATKLYWPVM